MVERDKEKGKGKKGKGKSESESMQSLGYNKGRNILFDKKRREKQQISII